MPSPRLAPRNGLPAPKPRLISELLADGETGCFRNTANAATLWIGEPKDAASVLVVSDYCLAYAREDACIRWDGHGSRWLPYDGDLVLPGRDR